MSNHGLGRIVIPDERDRQWALKPFMAEVPQLKTRYWWDAIHWYDQGETSQCTGASAWHYLVAGPITQGAIAKLPVPETIYREAQKVDEWEGENYEGSSVRAACKVLQRYGYISNYYWAWDVTTIANTLSNIGPVIVGTTWYYSMFEPDNNGLMKVSPESGSAGGHAYLLTGFNHKKRLFRIKNSWGTGWGKRGRGLITWEDMELLLADYGEAALPVEQKLIHY